MKLLLPKSQRPQCQILRNLHSYQFFQNGGGGGRESPRGGVGQRERGRGRKSRGGGELGGRVQHWGNSIVLKLLSFLSSFDNVLSHMIDCFRQHSINLIIIHEMAWGYTRETRCSFIFLFLSINFNGNQSQMSSASDSRLTFLTAYMSLEWAVLHVYRQVLQTVYSPYCSRSCHFHCNRLNWTLSTFNYHLFSQDSLVSFP